MLDARNSMIKEWFVEAATQIRNAAPIPLAYVASWHGYLTWDNLTKGVLFFYGLAQLLFLLWRWRRAARQDKANKESE